MNLPDYRLSRPDKGNIRLKSPPANNEIRAPPVGQTGACPHSLELPCPWPEGRAGMTYPLMRTPEPKLPLLYGKVASQIQASLLLVPRPGSGGNCRLFAALPAAHTLTVIATTAHVSVSFGEGHDLVTTE